jgi:hypothetical protein
MMPLEKQTVSWLRHSIALGWAIWVCSACGAAEGRDADSDSAAAVASTVGVGYYPPASTSPAVSPASSLPIGVQINVADDRSGGGTAPLLWVRSGWSWTPQLMAGGGDMTTLRWRRTSETDTLFVNPLGRDRPGIGVPLAVTDSMCSAGCPRDAVSIILSDGSYEVYGAPVVGFERGGSYRTLDRAGEPFGQRVSRADLGDRWPRTVASGWVDCVEGSLAVFRTRAASYALSGRAERLGYSHIDPTLRGPNHPRVEVETYGDIVHTKAR